MRTLLPSAFALEYSAAVIEGAADRGKSAVSAKQKPLPIAVGAEVSVHLDLPPQAFHCEEGANIVLVWDGMHDSAVFEVICRTQAELRRHVCKATISIPGQPQAKAVLRFELNVVAQNMPSPPASGLSSPASELAELPGATTLLPEVQADRPHIFISYRRTHFELADRVRRQLQTYGYRCFFDLDPQSGLGAGDFQTQLERSLRGVPYLLAIITPAPSGEDDVREGLSYTECIRHYAEQGWTDYCHVELASALADARTEVIPLFHPAYRSSDYGEQLRDLPADIASLAAKNAKPIGDAALFDKSIEVVHELIQRHIAANLRSNFQQDLERQLSSLSGDRIPAEEGVPPESQPSSTTANMSRCEPEPEPVVLPKPEPKIRPSQLPELEKGQHHVFISYTGRDKGKDAAFQALLSSLKGYGLNVFNPKEDPAGEALPTDKMRQHAANSMLTLALLSPNFFSSKYCRAEVEASAASQFCQDVIPVFAGEYYTRSEVTALFKDERPECQVAINAVRKLNVLDVHNLTHMDNCVVSIRTKIIHRLVAAPATEPEPEPEPEPLSPGSPEGVQPMVSSGVQNWSDKQVAAWLRDAMKLGDVADAASVEGGLDGATALELVRDDWMELGASGLEAAKIVAQLKKLV